MKLSSLMKIIYNYFGLIVLWTVVFFVTVFLVSIVMQNVKLKKSLSSLPTYLNSAENPVIINS